MLDEEYPHIVDDITHNLEKDGEYLLIFKPITNLPPRKIIFDSYVDVNDEMFISFGYYDPRLPDVLQNTMVPLSNIREIKSKYLSNPVLKGGKRKSRGRRRKSRSRRRKSRRSRRY